MRESITGPESITPPQCNNNLPDQSTTTVVRASQHLRYVRVQPSTTRFAIVTKSSDDLEPFPVVTASDPVASKLEADERRRLARIATSLQAAGVMDNQAAPGELRQSNVPARRIIIYGKGTDPDGLADLPFPEAAQKWHRLQKSQVGARTHINNWQNAMQLLKFFGDMKLSEMEPGHLRGYQDARTENAENRWAKKCGASIINHELSVLQQILKQAGQWNRFRDHYRALPLPAPKEEKIFSEEEEAEFLKLVASRTDLQLPCLVTMLTINTTCAGSELRYLKWKHIDLDNRDQEGNAAPTLTVPYEGAKNDFRIRTVPLNPTAVTVIKKVMARALLLNSKHPEHYLFPYSDRGYNHDPTRPMSDSWLRRGWKKLREAANAPWLTPHCIRYMAITALYDAGVPEPTIQAYAGHNSARMSRKYNRSRRSQLTAAAAVLDSSRRKELKPEWKQFVEAEADPRRPRASRAKARVLAFRSVS